MPDVFISYSRRDKDFVAKLHEALDAHGKEAWVDWEDIPASAQWLREIHDGIDSANAFLFVLSPDSVNSEVCNQELDHALERHKRILPIVHREVDPQAVHPEAAALNWVFLREQDSFDQGLRTLLQAIDTDLEHVKAHTRLAGQAINWERGGHDRARLLRGSELEAAERWLTEAAGKQPPPTELQAQFVQASRDASRRRGRVVFGAVTVALVVAVALAIVALIQRSNAVHQSKVAYARELDADAQNQYTTDPELGVLLAVQAAKVAPGAATREALRMALAQSHVRQRYTNPRGTMGDAQWSPDGRRLLIAEEGAGQAEIVRPGSGAPPIALRAPGLVSQIGWDASGRLAITGSSQVTIWNGSTGAVVRRLPTAGVDAALAPDGRTAATIDLAGVVHLWDLGTGRQRSQTSLARQGTPACLHWSPDGSLLLACMATVSEQLSRNSQPHETLTVFDGRTGGRLVSISQDDLIHDVAFSPDSRRLAVAVLGGASTSQSGAAIVYAARTGAQLLKFPGSASAVAFSPQGDKLAYASLRGSIGHVYTFADHSDVPLVGHTGSIQSIAFSHTGPYVVTAGADNTARVFNSFFGTPVEVLYGHTGEVTDATMSPDGSQLATASADGTARVWTTPVPHAQAQRVLRRGQSVFALSPQGDRLAVPGSGGGSELILDAHSLAVLSRLSPPRGERFGAAGFSPDGRWLAVLSGPAGQAGTVSSDRVQVYDTRSGTVAAAIGGSSQAITLADFAGSSALAVLTADGQVASYGLPGGRLVRRLVPAGRRVQDLAYSSDYSKLALTHPDGSVDVLSASGQPLRTLRGPAPQPLYPGLRTAQIPIRAAFSPDGKWIATAGAGHSVRLWEVATGRQAQTLSAGSTPFISLAFSPDSRTLAAGDSASAHLWQVPSGAHLQELKHADPSTWGGVAELSPVGGVQVGFSRDGGTLVTSGDLEVRAWNPQSDEMLFEAQFTVFGQITADAQRLVGLSGPRVAVYACEECGGLDQLLAAAARDTTRSLTPGERALYLHQS